ncbi:hypothetical protein Q9233_004398 [Columba guinea]|nr:hypothetical protein Q9233_004398 [Columba guinea]
MNDCYSRLRKLVPTIPPNKRVSKVEILQHVIDYILDLQLALETHPALLRQQQQPPALHPGSCPAGTPRTPLTALNTDPINGSFEAVTVYPNFPMKVNAVLLSKQGKDWMGSSQTKVHIEQEVLPAVEKSDVQASVHVIPS